MAVSLLSEPLRGFDHTPISIHQPSDGLAPSSPLGPYGCTGCFFMPSLRPQKKHAAVHGEKSAARPLSKNHAAAHGEKSAARPLSKKSCGSTWRKICRPACASKNHAAAHGVKSAACASKNHAAVRGEKVRRPACPHRFPVQEKKKTSRTSRFYKRFTETSHGRMYSSL